MRTTTLTITALILFAIGAGGCGGGLPAGQAGLRVLVKAEPKTGYTLDVKTADVYAGRPEVEDATAARRDPFRPLDYRNLSDIVVYLVPQSGSAAAAPTAKPIDIDAVAGNRQGRWTLGVSAVGGEVRIGNASPTPRAVYIRTEAGTLSDIGTVAPGASVSATMSAPGSITVWAESGKAEDDRLAEIFVAPNGWVATTVSGGNVTFAPVPAGTYTLHTWHPRLPGQSQQATLAADKYTDATATVTVNVLPPAK
ncbi:hypothetical protein [Humisphaera borealis]|uniref:Uncharacterized protein n=1 Tax=Humisphaera borealis TaxID=2807512 RepID=A0A7M2X0V7_9BACT|nr:hypothetical protein [Humisphaera borealis]QOV90370.1 hypothetical protein IPV69_03090 [Humisphaera borealis]